MAQIMIWNFNIHTDRVIKASRPDTVVVDNRNAETSIIDIGVPGNCSYLQSKRKIIKEDRKIFSTRINPPLENINKSHLHIVIEALGALHKTAD